MPKFSFTVMERIEHECLYIVEAVDMDEAEQKAERGETVDEQEIKIHGVTSREIVDAGVLILGCKKCGSDLDDEFCSDSTCHYHDRKQDATFTEE